MGQELIVAVIAAALATLIVVVGDKLRPASWRHKSDEGAGELVLDLIKTFFTAVVAFVVVVCWQQFEDAHDHTVSEANALVNVYWDTHSMPAPENHQIPALVSEYTHQVVTQEWSSMKSQGRMSPAAQTAFDHMRGAVTAVNSTDPTVVDLRSRAMDQLEQAAQARQQRGLDLTSAIPRFLYVVLIFGTVLLMLYPVLSGVRVSWRSAVMTALLGFVVGSALLQIYNLERPFAGSIVVSRDAFDDAVSRYQQISTDQLPAAP
ncbi:DUF4239 domain-containing protein [Nocardia alni]|uniref:bestrophin-like domain n=1 Tax=Nocardia alni TaxID=2815723 RepID=UPI001C22C76D|nr:DUF4239 domain-containing protein [Nocardia alni]